MKKAIVLSSGGVDSTVCVAMAVAKYGAENVATTSIFYGQKHNKELECARKVADYYKLPHYEFDLSSVLQFSNCSLLAQSTQAIEHKSYAEQITPVNGKVSTYVPFRNGLMLSVCASLAQSIFENDDVEIYLGAHGDDAAGNAYADCSEIFVSTMSRAISIGTYEQVRVTAPFAGLSKADVVKKGLELKAPFELTWSCYEGGDKPCGECGTCIDRAKAFAANNVKDPAIA
ncbi:7-cyano-7-deazaguanine synthase [Fibrobacter sp. UWH9]|uniref:7-cyano-7-deazaguanine synthase QueC n=1 Tax=unclassified Fibrobacter TaxID=2634177 RepID=UPI0009126F2B|nr:MULTISPECIES: 7-cyano-7-deazaguanine synthase QueC [unclassified Fibrobacter]MDO4947508.1 7-cyano-7-deazaguanine synthase QueC [Fibrobacter sp.]OWV07771.1 7-cyano-7-deazaguanine synthase QueC [Fibrobacter sp. UWH3]SHG78836.1 7-cyano-7-deazaguanine synthase [Fibrobacter sp. UWH9]SHK51289.1 7-cyano-7-deazaguanine synthase [Fibrobacter sp. UWH6]SHL81788.1 7-cyano-7-deazaguanine synthase [Fibrobacter sp. UWH5]